MMVRQTYDKHVKGDTSLYFVCYASIHKHLTALDFESKGGAVVSLLKRHGRSRFKSLNQRKKSYIPREHLEGRAV